MKAHLFLVAEGKEQTVSLDREVGELKYGYIWMDEALIAPRRNNIDTERPCRGVKSV